MVEPMPEEEKFVSVEEERMMTPGVVLFQGADFERPLQ